MGKLHHSFQACEKLRKHIGLLLSHGCMYAVYNNNLLFHASIPLNADGSLKEVEIYPGKRYAGKDLMYHIGMQIRARSEEHTSELQSRQYLVCRLLLEKKKRSEEHTSVLN